MARRLRAYVHGVVAEDGSMRGFGPGDDVPEWAAVQIADHNWVDVDTAPAASSPAVSPPVDDDRPPKGGAGSGLDAWRAYAEAHGFDVADDATRDDIIAAVEAD